MILLKENAVMTTNRKAHTIYIDDLLYNEITNVPELANYSFSKKVSFILQKYLDDQNNKENKKKPPSQEKNQKIRFIDLFAGIGGIRLGFEGHSHDTECVYSSEWDKYAQKTYEANFGDKPDGDITKVKAKDIPDFDVLLAGFPCQPFSSIGKREGFANKTQGTLFFDILRILKYHMPSAFLLENVPGLLTIQHGETFNIIINALKESGYSVHSKVLEASNFGLAQSRKRVIIVGFRNDIDDSKFIIPEGNGKNTYVKDILEDNPQGYTISKRLQQNYLFKKDDGRPYIVDKTTKNYAKTLNSSYHKIQRLTGTFVRGGETGLRLLSKKECMRLQGFPDDFKIPVSRTQMYRQMGNSVAIPMIEAVSDNLKAVLRKKPMVNTLTNEATEQLSLI
jgi:DNA (cytosine-5)-methyltransferase 1